MAHEIGIQMCIIQIAVSSLVGQSVFLLLPDWLFCLMYTCTSHL